VLPRRRKAARERAKQRVERLVIAELAFRGEGRPLVLQHASVHVVFGDSSKLATEQAHSVIPVVDIDANSERFQEVIQVR
jgi:hypothetical protein